MTHLLLRVAILGLLVPAPALSQYISTFERASTSHKAWIERTTGTDSSYIYYSFCDNGGNTWSKPKQVAPVFLGKKPSMNEQQVSLQIACDTGFSEFKGRIYICWADEKHGRKDKDVYLVYSDDKGSNWTEPILVTYYPNHKAQFAPQLRLDKQSGEMNIFYFDQQNYYDDSWQDLYLAQSKNGGLKFDYFKLNTLPLEPKKSEFRVAQQNTDLEINWREKNKHCTVRVNDSVYKSSAQKMRSDITVDRAFVFSGKIKINFKADENLNMTAVVNKPLDPNFETLVFKNKYFLKGENTFVVYTDDIGIPAGNYVLMLYYNTKNTYVWITE